MTEQQNILPQDPTEAVRHITKVASKLIEVMEREANALAVKDTIAFAAAQEEKERLSKNYQQSSEEFKARIMDFRDVEKAFLDRLNQVQLDLKAKTEENSATMERMQG